MSDIVDSALQVTAGSKTEAKSEAKATVKKSKDWKYDAKVVVERKDGNLNITGNLEQSSAGPCSDYLPLGAQQPVNAAEKCRPRRPCRLACDATKGNLHGRVPERSASPQRVHCVHQSSKCRPQVARFQRALRV